MVFMSEAIDTTDMIFTLAGWLSSALKWVVIALYTRSCCVCKVQKQPERPSIKEICSSGNTDMFI